MAGGRLFRAPIRHDFGDPAVVILLAATKKNNDGVASTFIHKTNATAHSLHTCTISVLLYRIHSSFGNQRGRKPFVRIALHTLVDIKSMEYCSVFCCQIREVVHNFPFRRSEVYLDAQMTGRRSKRYSSCHANRTRTARPITFLCTEAALCTLNTLLKQSFFLIFHVFYLL